MTDKPDYVPHEILVMIKSDVSDQDAHKAIANAGGTVVRQNSNGRLRSVLLEASSVETTLKKLEQSSCFDAIQRNYRSKTTDSEV